jgi:hypothetical protein
MIELGCSIHPVKIIDANNLLTQMSGTEPFSRFLKIKPGLKPNQAQARPSSCFGKHEPCEAQPKLGLAHHYWRGPRLLETLRDLSKQEADPKWWCMARQTNNETTMIYWEGTPQDLWHHWEGQRPYSIHPPQKWEHLCSQSQNLL